MRLNSSHLSLFAILLLAAPAPLHADPLPPPAKDNAPLISGLGDLKKLDRQLISIADRAADATVALVSVSAGATGSGVIVSREGLILTAVNGNPVTDPEEFPHTITSFKFGDNVKLHVRRGEEMINLDFTLAERPMWKPAPEFLKVNSMSGALSPKIDGFSLALQHDIPLEPAQCGSPLLDLEGRCLGINVSRAGRVNTLAIPATSIAELLDSARAELSATAAKA